MKYTYESVETFSNIFYVKRTDELGGEAWIPTDPANSDYQAYLATLVTESAPTA